MNCCDLLYFSQFAKDSVKEEILRQNLHYELLHITKGECKLFYNDGEFNCFEGDIVIIPLHVKYRAYSESPISFSIIGFDKSSWNFSDKPVLFKKYDNLYAGQLLNNIKSEFESYRFGRKQSISLLLNIVLIQLFRNFKACDTKKDIEHDNFNFILRLMESHSNLGLDIEEVAKTSGLSYHRFRHKFKEIVGISPQQYIIKQRLNFAKRLLETSNYSTSQIANACDFHSVPQFITCFNKQEGLTPVKYRKSFKKTSKNKENAAVPIELNEVRA